MTDIRQKHVVKLADEREAAVLLPMPYTFADVKAVLDWAAEKLISAQAVVSDGE